MKESLNKEKRGMEEISSIIRILSICSFRKSLSKTVEINILSNYQSLEGCLLSTFFSLCSAWRM